MNQNLFLVSLIQKYEELFEGQKISICISESFRNPKSEAERIYSELPDTTFLFYVHKKRKVFFVFDPQFPQALKNESMKKRWINKCEEYFQTTHLERAIEKSILLYSAIRSEN